MLGGSACHAPWAHAACDSPRLDWAGLWFVLAFNVPWWMLELTNPNCVLKVLRTPFDPRGHSLDHSLDMTLGS